MKTQVYADPLDALLAHAKARGLNVWVTEWADRVYWKAREGSKLVDLGRTPAQLLERLREREACR